MSKRALLCSVLVAAAASGCSTQEPPPMRPEGVVVRDVAPGGVGEVQAQLTKPADRVACEQTEGGGGSDRPLPAVYGLSLW